MIRSLIGRLRSSSTTEKSRFYADLDIEEQEEDGFLLIGATASDRTRVTHQQFVAQQKQVDAPPEYDAITKNSMTVMPGLPPLGVSTVHEQQHHVPPVSDVPFELAPQLTVVQRLDTFNAGFALIKSSFDWTKYEYDFGLEINYLKEMGMPVEKHPCMQQPVKKCGDLITF